VRVRCQRHHECPDQCDLSKLSDNHIWPCCGYRLALSVYSDGLLAAEFPHEIRQEGAVTNAKESFD